MSRVRLITGRLVGVAVPRLVLLFDICRVLAEKPTDQQSKKARNDKNGQEPREADQQPIAPIDGSIRVDLALWIMLPSRIHHKCGYQ